MRRLPAGSGFVLALGANLWLLALGLPIAITPASRTWPLLPIAPLLVGLGVWRRSAPALLFGVPVATLVPLVMPELEEVRQSAVGFGVAACALVAYELAALRFLDEKMALSETRPLPHPTSAMRAPALWLHRALPLVAVLLPAWLLYRVDLHAGTTAAIAAHYAASAERAQAAITAGVGLVVALVFARLLLPNLADHLDHDVELRVQLERRRLAAARGRPSATFYAAVGLAVALMAIVLFLRAHIGSAP